LTEPTFSGIFWGERKENEAAGIFDKKKAIFFLTKVLGNSIFSVSIERGVVTPSVDWG